MGLVESGKMPKPLTKLLNLSRKYSIWAYQWGLACCAIEMGAAFASPRYDVMRLGVIPFPASPRQADLVVISGTVTDKIVPAIKRLYEQMPDPKYVISMGSCTNCGGPYWDSYSVTKGVDQIVPVDVYVPGLPAPARGAARGRGAAPGAHPQRGHGRALEGRAGPAGADRRWLTTPPPPRRPRRRSSPTTAARRCWPCSPSTSATPCVDSLIKPGPGPLDPGGHRRVGRRRRGRARQGRLPLLRLPLGDRLAAVALRPLRGQHRRRAVPAADARPLRRRARLRRRRQPPPDAGVGGQGRHRRARAPQGRRPRRRPPRPHLDPRLLGRRVARARDPRDVRHRLRRQRRPPPHLPPVGVRGAPAAQGVPAARPGREAVARASSTSSRCPARTPRTRKPPKGRRTHDADRSPTPSSSATSTPRRPTAASTSSSRPTTAWSSTWARSTRPPTARCASSPASTASRSRRPTSCAATCTAATRSSARSAATRRSPRW